MAGGTLLISREVLNHQYYKKRFESFGFKDVEITDEEKDAQYSKIRKVEPELIIMSARFYQCCTPFLMGELHREFPEIKLASVVLGEYSPDVAMYFILNGITSYITSFDGMDQFYKGLDELAKGGDWVSPSVNERIALRRDYPAPAGKITERHNEVVRLICCGFKDDEIADTLAISRRTVVRHKTDLFTSLNVRSPIELVRAALTLEIIRLEELYFHPRNYTVNPIPEKYILGRSRE
ncbi:MAG: LuxR C-terminal-related transcriptional regulator [Treponema sp.]|jgi:DNA-binding NarL/FixJ family response regulator|nr:LuxR C-terminal-related transcriptional regulator [Treponema sp.]